MEKSYPYEILLVDADMTLLDFKKSEKTALQKTLEHFRVPSVERAKESYRRINNAYWEKLERGEVTKKELVYLRYKDLLEELQIDGDYREYEEYYQDTLGDWAYKMEGAEDICHYLYGKYKLYLVTNGISKTQYSRMKKSGLFPYFEDIFVSEDSGYQKPMVEYFDYVFSKIGEVDKKKMLIIGDSLSSDIQGGINIGIDTCWFNYLYEERPKLPITYEINRLEELRSFL